MNKGVDIWARALQKINEEDRRRLELEGRARIDILTDLQSLTETARDDSIKKRWRFRRPGTGEIIILRDLFGKIVSWIDLFKQVGDNAVQYDPQHAALPWAAVRFVLQVAISDVVKFEFVVETVESIARIISRCAIFEDLYLRRTSPATKKLEEALVALYAAILRSLAKAKAFFQQSTPKRVLKGVFVAEEEFQDLLTKISNEQSEVDRCALLVQSESHNNLSDTLNALALDGDERQSELLRLLEVIDGPINRMSIQIQGIEDRLETSKRMAILSWISSQPYIEHHERIKRDDVPERGKWLLDDPVYTRWHKESSCSLLWLHGKVGSGKTTLTAIVVDDVLQRSAACQNPPPVFFFCSRNAAEPGRSNPDDILASVVRQLVCVKPESQLNQSIIAKFEKKGQGFESKGLRLEESRDLILELIDQYSMTTIIIDALDEIDSDKRWTLIEALQDILQEATGLIKIFVSSRDDQDIVCSLTDYPSFDITSDDNKRDIEKFVRTETERLIQKRRLLRYSKCRDELKSLIIEQVCKGADGMFRWVVLQLELLCALQLDADVIDSLGRLPPGLQELYTELYERQISQHPGKNGQATIQNVLKWLLCAQTSMNSRELCTAVAMNLPISVEELSKEHILDLCQNFIAYDDALDNFIFVHLSVREFLETRPEYWHFECHKLAAEACLLQLIGSTDSPTARDFLRNEYSLDIPRKVASMSNPHGGGFHEYSVRYWTHHCRWMDEKDRQSHDRFQRVFQFFFSPDCGNPSPLNLWMLSYRRRKYHWDDPNHDAISVTEDKSAPIKPFFIACYFGFCEILNEYLKNHHITAEERREAWDVACGNDQDEALKTLLVNRGDCVISESLVRKVIRSFMTSETLSWVLRQTHNINLTVGLMDSALISGDPDKGKVLLDHYNTSEVSYEVLLFAASNLSESEFKILLNRCPGIEVNQAMFEKAVDGENHEVVKMLMREYGFKVTNFMLETFLAKWTINEIQAMLEQGNYTISSRAMRNAVKNEDSGVFQLLLNHGGTINHSVLAVAAEYGNLAMLQMLLDCGHPISKVMLLMGVRNKRDRDAVINFLLNGVDDVVKTEESHAIMKRAARDREIKISDLYKLKCQLHCDEISEDIAMAAVLGHHKIIDDDRFLIEFCDNFSLTAEVFEKILEDMESKDSLQHLLDRLDDSKVSEGILKGAAGNLEVGDDLMRILLDKFPNSQIPECVWNAAISNWGCGLEIFMLLENRLGHVNITEDQLMRAASAGARVVEHLLERFPTANIQENVIMHALNPSHDHPSAIRFLLERFHNLHISDQIVEKAARDAVYPDFKLLWARCNDTNVSSKLVQAASENRGQPETLRFLTGRLQDIELGEETVAAMIQYHTIEAIEILEDYLEFGQLFQISRNVLMEAAGNSRITESNMIFLLHQANIDAVNDKVFQVAAASGRNDILTTLCDHCKLDEVPSKWTDIAKLHDAAVQEAWYFRPRWSDFDDDSYDRDMEISLVRDLLAKNIPCDLPDGDGDTPLALAAKAGNELIAKALLDAGANPDNRNRFGWTPLFHAASLGHYDIVVALIEKGAETDLEDSYGLKIMDNVKKKGHMKIYRLLQSYNKGER